MKTQTKIIILSMLLGMVVLIGVLHALTPGHLILYHDTYRRLGYFPIVVGAILFGVRGGIGMAVASSISFIPHLYLFFAKGPQAYYSELSEIFFYLAAGLVIGLISSRENRLREKYKRLSEQLAGSYNRLHDQASRLMEAEKQLGESRKLSMLGQVSASLAHEIKNPLTSIKGAAEILADEVGKDHPKYEFVEIMRSEISRLNTSVDEVLSYCRGQQISDKTEQERIGAILNHVILLLGDRITEKRIKLSMPEDLQSMDFYTDKAGMTQVLINIILNAMDAVAVGGRIDVGIRQSEKGCRISVSDDGPGIDPQINEIIFNPFVTAKKGGTGLGLAICQKIVKSLGGEIYAEPSDLGGAGICLILPEKTALLSKLLK